MRKTDTDIKEVIKQVQKILLNPKTQVFVQAIYGKPLLLTVQSATEISTNLTNDIKGTSQLVGIGIGSSLTGKHFDFIFTDDIVNINDRVSRAERERTKLVYQELQNIKNRGGRIFNTGTPWHKSDCFSIMPEAEKYNCYNEHIKKIISETELAQIKASMSPSLFAANYELKHIAAENLLFSERPMNADISNIMNTICQIDCAYGGEDYTAFTAMSYHDGHFYIYGKCWQKHIEDCYDEITFDYRRLMLGKCFVETNADKGMIAKDMKRKFGMRMVSYHEKTNKHIKISTYLKAIWEYVVFVSGTDTEYINQILDYTEDAEHDDCPDSAAVLARRLYKKANININVDLNDEVGEYEN
jgi:phage terminase large subunit-like protein